LPVIAVSSSQEGEATARANPFASATSDHGGLPLRRGVVRVSTDRHSEGAGQPPGGSGDNCCAEFRPQHFVHQRLRLDRPVKAASRPRARPRHIWSKVGFAREFRLADHSGRQGKAVLAARFGDKREDLCAEQQLRDLFPERGIRMLDVNAILPSCTEAAASAV
jgi:hypothetical protein